ncbi:hypothetical protein HPT29_024665 [Microvirga terrae]|uniref:Nuclear transport factor 2 family protein n=1 Tax=Microvirga terrae TaxID=2740529 RepID=A0ABY5RRD5_9HYPH|nr:hypothetical protein [Microvirga terrae]UVF19568.1 hypothetical protein HPT29_024665 [Microvirga terrae]
MIRAVSAALALAASMLASSALAAEWADDEAQADACERTLALLTTGKVDEAVDAIFLVAQPWDPRAVRARQEYAKLADSMRGFVRAGLDAVHRQNDSTIVRSHRRVSRPTLGERVIHVEQWEFDNGRKVYAGCVRWPNAAPGKGWVTEMEFGPDEAEVVERLGEKVRRMGAK